MSFYELMIQNSKLNSQKSKIEDGKDDPRSIWKLFKEFGASKNDGRSENIQELKMIKIPYVLIIQKVQIYLIIIL